MCSTPGIPTREKPRASTKLKFAIFHGNNSRRDRPCFSPSLSRQGRDFPSFPPSLPPPPFHFVHSLLDLGEALCSMARRDGPRLLKIRFPSRASLRQSIRYGGITRVTAERYTLRGLTLSVFVPEWSFFEIDVETRARARTVYPIPY